VVVVISVVVVVVVVVVVESGRQMPFSSVNPELQTQNGA
jgi:hypothetical protein